MWLGVCWQNLLRMPLRAVDTHGGLALEPPHCRRSDGAAVPRENSGVFVLARRGRHDFPKCMQNRLTPRPDGI
jgi:hypothetical protein